MGHHSRIRNLGAVLSLDSSVNLNFLAEEDAFFVEKTGEAMLETQLSKMADSINVSNADMVFLDFPWNWLGELHLRQFFSTISRHKRVTCIDGPSFEVPPEFARIFPTLGRPSIPISDGKSRWGSQYVLTDRREVDWVWTGANDCLFLTGTTAPEAYFERINLHLKNDVLQSFDFSWAVGPYASSWLRDSLNELNIFPIPIELYETRRSKASFAVCRFGVGALEMLSLCTPTIILPGWSELEAGEIADIRSNQLAMVVDDWSELDSSLSELLSTRSVALDFVNNCRDYFAKKASPQDWLKEMNTELDL